MAYLFCKKCDDDVEADREDAVVSGTERTCEVYVCPNCGSDLGDCDEIDDSIAEDEYYERQREKSF